MYNKDLKIEVSDKNCIGYNEVYREFFECPNCYDGNLIDSYNFCPNCGCKLEWNLIKSFSPREELIINTGNLKCVRAKFYDFNRRTSKVTVMIDKNKLVLDYKDIVRKSE